MAGFGVPLDCKARFEKERGYPLTFIEKIGKRSNITNNRIIMLINDEEYVEGEDYEFIPYRILLVCPFDNTDFNNTRLAIRVLKTPSPPTQQQRSTEW